MNFKMVKPMLKMASGKLKEFLGKNDDKVEIGMVVINDWLTENKFPFEVDIDDEDYKIIVKLKKEGN